MKLQLLTYLAINLCHGFTFDKNSSSQGCGKTEECRPLSECPAAVTNLKENKLRPKLCSFHVRSVSICCKKSDVVPPIERQRCGVRKTAETFLEFSPNFSEPQFRDLIEFNDEIVLQVVGGEESEENSLPWMAVLGQRNQTKPAGIDWFCGGAFIGERLVLTAAHCIEPNNPQNRTLDLVRLGGHDLSLAEEVGAVDYGVEKVFIHPLYSRGASHLVNDIAIIVLDAPGVSQSTVSPVCLPSPDDEELQPGAPLTAAGWGARHPVTGDRPDRLHEVTVEFSDQNSCAASYRRLGIDIGEDVLCAGHPQGGRDACGGDSGGALLHQNPRTGAWTAVGVVSWGKGCGRREFQGIYTNVASYLAWVEEVRQLVL